MNEDQWSATKRAFLTAIGTIFGAGCLAPSKRENNSQEEPPDKSTNESRPEPDQELEPNEPDPKPDEPTLFLDNDSRGLLWDNGSQWQSGEQLDEWKVLAGSAEISTNQAYRGWQSIHMTAAGDGRTAVRIPLDGFDLTKTSFSVAMYIETPGPQIGPSFDVNAPACEAQLHFRTRHKIDKPGWIRYDLGISHTSALESTEESYMTISWAGNVDWYLADIRAVPVEEEPRLFIQFDDSRRTTYDTAFPIMREYGIEATVFTITGREGYRSHLTLSQMEEMQDAGWEFGSHTHTHRRTGELSLDDQRTELEKSKEWLLDHGFTQAASTLAYPFGSFTTATMDIASEYYNFATHVQYGATNRTINSPLSVNRHLGDDPEKVRELIDLLLDERIPTDTLVLCYHDVIEGHDDWITPTEFRETMAYIDESGVQCLLTSELRDHQFE